jgi:rRNA maturation endonuclease Nob1
MSVIDSVRTGLGIVHEDLHHCWECDANFQSAGPLDECVYCGSTDVRTF